MRCASGVRLYYEVHGDGPTTVLLLPPWSIVHSRIWKLQVPYLARHAQVVVYDGRGNGRSDRPAGPVGVRRRRAGRRRAGRAGRGRRVRQRSWSDSRPEPGCSWCWRPTTRTGCAVPSSPARTSCSQDRPNPIEDAFERERDSYDGWWRWNAHHWRRDQAGFAEFFFGEAFPEAHSTKQVEDAVAWALETDAETLVATHSPRRRVVRPAEALAAAEKVRCPSPGDARRRRPHHPARRRAWPSRARSGVRSTWWSVAATASRRGTRSGSTCGCAGSWRR